MKNFDDVVKKHNEYIKVATELSELFDKLAYVVNVELHDYCVDNHYLTDDAGWFDYNPYRTNHGESYSWHRMYNTNAMEVEYDYTDSWDSMGDSSSVIIYPKHIIEAFLSGNREELFKLVIDDSKNQYEKEIITDTKSKIQSLERMGYKVTKCD